MEIDVVLADIRAVAASRRLDRVFGVVAQLALAMMSAAAFAGMPGDDGPAIHAQVHAPGNVAVDSKGKLYIVQRKDNVVREVARNGTITTIAGSGASVSSAGVLASSKGLQDIATDANGNLYIAQAAYVDRPSYVREVSPSGAVTTVASSGPPSPTRQSGEAGALAYAVSALAIGPDHALYVVDDGRCQKLSANGTITTLTGGPVLGYEGDDGPAIRAKLNMPGGIAVSPNGDIYIADTGNHRVRKISSKGVISTVAGNGVPDYSGDNGPAMAATLYRPAGIALDHRGNLYIADSGNHRIRKVSTSGIISTVAGNGAAAYAGDDGPAIEAALYYPSGIALDDHDNLYIADTYNNRVRKVSPFGVITTVAGNGSEPLRPTPPPAPPPCMPGSVRCTPPPPSSPLAGSTPPGTHP